MTANYYKNHDYNKLEMVICLEDVVDRTGKFFIPALTPFLNSDTPEYKKDPPYNTINILSDVNKLGLKQCYTSNYLDIKLPEYIDSAKKGDKFVIAFIGGDINKPYILGRYEE